MTRDTRELDFAHHRQLFLTEQGYSYEILDQSDVLPAGAAAAGGGPHHVDAKLVNGHERLVADKRAGPRSADPGEGASQRLAGARSSPPLADELLARPKLGRLIVGRLSADLLLVSPGKASEVVEELRKMGHTPQVVGRMSEFPSTQMSRSPVADSDELLEATATRLRFGFLASKRAHRRLSIA